MNIPAIVTNASKNIINEAFETYLINVLISEDIREYEGVPYNVLESHGLFNGCKELARKIIKDLNNHRNESNISLTYTHDNFKQDMFFDVLFINADINKKYYDISGEYEPADTSYGKELIYNDISKRLFVVTITLEINNKNLIDGTYEVLLHELTHAYEDYHRIKNTNYGILKERTKEKYDKILKELDSDEAIHNLLGSILYVTVPFEQNAFIAQFHGTLKENDKKYRTVHGVLDAIMNDTALGRQYKTISKFISELKYDELGERNESIKIFRNIFKNECKNKSDDEVVSDIIKRWNKFSKKLRQHMYDICEPYIKN